MVDNKLIDIEGLEVVYEDILTTLKDSYIKNSDVQESKTVTPNTYSQTIEADTGKSYLKQVVVDKIPSKYQDTTEVTASTANVLIGKKFVNSSGLQTGTMPNIGKQTISLSTTSRSVAISKGYHDGTGTATIPSDYFPVNSTNTTATASDILLGKKVVGTDGATITGNISTVTPTKTQPTATATAGTTNITKQPSASITIDTDPNNTGIFQTGTSGYPIVITASASSGIITATGGSASTTEGSLSVNKGYVAANTSVSVEARSAAGAPATSTEQTASKTETIYVPKGKVTLSAGASAGSASIAPTGFTQSASTTPYYVTLTTKDGTAKADATLTTGYISEEFDNPAQSRVPVTVSGNNTTLYIPEGALNADASVSSGTASIVAKGFVSSDTETGYYVELTTTPGSATPSASVSTEGYIPSGTNKTCSAKAVSVTGNGSKVYIPTVTYTSTATAEPNSASYPDAVSAIIPKTSAQYVQIDKGYTPNKRIKINAIPDQQPTIDTTLTVGTTSKDILLGYYSSKGNVDVKVASDPTITTLDASGVGSIVATAATGFYKKVNVNVGGQTYTLGGSSFTGSSISPSTSDRTLSLSKGYSPSQKSITISKASAMYQSVSIATGDWNTSTKQCSKTVTGMTSSCSVMMRCTTDSGGLAGSGQVLCTTQAANSLTFTYSSSSKPSGTIVFDVVWYGF